MALISSRVGQFIVFAAYAALITGCSTSGSQSGAPPPLADDVGAVVGPVELCVHRREVLRVSPAECERLQAEERAAAGPVEKVLDRATIEYAPRELSLDLLEGIVVGARYKYRVEPSYRDSYFTRIDAYTFRTGATPGDLLAGVPLRVGFERGNELLFAQQFVSGEIARSPASTYLPNRAPLSASKALELKVGDYARFNTRLSLLANAGQVWPLAGFMLKADAGVSVLLDGMYQVHVFRLDESRVRLKLVAERARDVTVSASVAPNPLVKVALLNRVSNRLVPLAELEILDAQAAVAASKAQSSLFLVDYTLDLADEDAARAYNHIFDPSLMLTDVVVSNPLRDKFELRDKLLSSIEDIDRLARRDLGLTDAKVSREFQGANYSSSRSIKFSVKVSTFDVTRSRVFRENFLTRSDLREGDVDERSFYLLPTWTNLRDRSMLFGMLDESQVRTADALFVADAEGAPVRFMNIGFGLEYQDARLRPSEYRRLRRKLEHLLPAEAERQFAELMTGTQWLEDNYRHNFAMSLRYFFRESAFDGLVAAGYGDEAKLEQALATFIVDGIEQNEFPLFRGTLAELVQKHSTAAPSSDPAALRAQATRVVAAEWKSQISNVAEHLAKGFTSGQDSKARMNAVLALRNSSFYQQVGTAFWVDLVQRAGLDLSDSMFLNLTLKADGHQGVELAYGEPEERELYESVMFIQNVLNDRSLDMREKGELDNVISKMTVVAF